MKIKNWKFSRGFTLIELLVVIAIISLLVSILLPSLNKAKELARQTVCMSQMKQMGTGLVFYLEDNNQMMPLTDLRTPSVPWPDPRFWPNSLAPYIDSGMPKPSLHADMEAKGKWFFWCPSNNEFDLVTGGTLYTRSYGANYDCFSNRWTDRKFTDIEQDIVLIMDAWLVYLYGSYPMYSDYWEHCARFRHNDKANVLWSDFHVGSSYFEGLDDSDFYSE